MIPLRLLKGLEKRFNDLFVDKKYPRPAKETEELGENYYSAINVFTQNLPIKEQVDEVYAPFIITKINSGSQAKNGDKHLTHLSILVGMYDESAMNGFENVALVLNQIVESLSKNPIIEKVFELDLESRIEWEISDEETYPYCYGGVTVHFKTPIIEFGQRYDLEGLI